MAADKENPCRECFADPNYAIICSFFEKFAQLCGINHLTFAELQEMLENTVEVPQPLVDLHIKLLRKVRKSCPPDKWERALIKFAHTHSKQDGWELERFGYKNSTIEVKLRLLKHLLEAQFDMNPKFKAEVNKLMPSELRIEPLGRDQNGFTYWCQFDPTSHVRIYKEDPDEDDSWDMIAKDRDGLVNLIDSLCSGEGQKELSLILNEENANSGVVERPVTDTGQEPDSATPSPIANKEDLNKEQEPSPVEDNSEVGDTTELDTPKDNPEPTDKHKVEAVSEVQDKNSSEQPVADVADVEEDSREPAKDGPTVQKPGSRLDEIFRVKGIIADERISIESKDSLLAQMSECFNRETEGKRLNSGSPPNDNTKRQKVEEEESSELPETMSETEDVPSVVDTGKLPEAEVTPVNHPTKTESSERTLKPVENGTNSDVTQTSIPEGISKADDSSMDSVPVVMSSKVSNDSETVKIPIKNLSAPDIHEEKFTASDLEDMIEEDEEIEEEEDDLDDDVSSDIEEPLMLVTGEGSGTDCDAVNPLFLRENVNDSSEEETIVPGQIGDLERLEAGFEELGEVIEEPLMIITGEGSGTDCDTGNVEPEGAVTENSVKSENHLGGTNGDHIDESTNCIEESKIKPGPLKVISKDVPADSVAVHNNIQDDSNLKNGVDKTEKIDESNCVDSNGDAPVITNVKSMSKNAEEDSEDVKPLNNIKVKEEQEKVEDEEGEDQASSTKEVIKAQPKKKRKNKTSSPLTQSESIVPKEETVEIVGKIESELEKEDSQSLSKEVMNSDDSKEKEEVIVKKEKTNIKEEETRNNEKEDEKNSGEEEEETNKDSTLAKESENEKKEEDEDNSSRRRSTRSGGRIPPPLILPKKERKKPTTPKPAEEGKESDSTPSKGMSLTNFSIDMDEKPPPSTGKKKGGKNTSKSPIKVEAKRALTTPKKGKSKAAARKSPKKGSKTAPPPAPAPAPAAAPANDSEEEKEKVATPKSRKSRSKKKRPASKGGKKDKTVEEKNKTVLKDKETKEDDTEAPAKENKETEKADEKAVKNVTKPRTKRGSSSLLGLLPSDIVPVGDSEGRSMRQSRRLAQIKIKEQQTERKAIDMAIQESKKSKSKKDRDPQYKGKLTGDAKKGQKRKKRHSEEEVASLEDSNDVKKKAKRGRKRKKDRFTYDISHPWKSSSDDSSHEGEEDDLDHLDMYEDDEDLRSKPLPSDHEFSPESDLEKEGDGEMAATRRARTAKKDEEGAKEEAVDDTACKKCSKSDHPEWILLCDKCDSGWHASCLRPAIMVIPEGDWFCPPCQHAALVGKLKETLRIFEQDAKRRENDELRRKRLAYVGISLSNVLPIKGEGRKKKKFSGSSASSISGYSSESSSSSSSEEEPVYQLRARRAQHQSYSFNDYDQLINSAIQEEYGDDLPPPPPKHVSIGKDIGTIERVNRAAEEAEAAAATKADGEEGKEDDDEEGGEGWKPRVVPKHVNIAIRKKPRKLNNLDESSADDDANDSDFKGSASEDEDDDPSASDSDRYVVEPVRRSNRARQSRIDREFINDDSDSDSDNPRKKKKRRQWSESESESSDASWGRRKKRSKAGGSSRKKKPSRKFYDETDSDEKPRKSKPKKPRVRFGGLDDDGEVLTSRTRGKKMSYQETDDSFEDDDDEPSRAGRNKKVIESDTEEEEEFEGDDHSEGEGKDASHSESGEEEEHAVEKAKKEEKDGKVIPEGDEKKTKVTPSDKSVDKDNAKPVKESISDSAEITSSRAEPPVSVPTTTPAVPDSTASHPEIKKAQVAKTAAPPINYEDDLMSDEVSEESESSESEPIPAQAPSGKRPSAIPPRAVPPRASVPPSVGIPVSGLPPVPPLVSKIPSARIPVGLPRMFPAAGFRPRVPHGGIPFRPSPSLRARLMRHDPPVVPKVPEPSKGSLLNKVLSSNPGISASVTVTPPKAHPPAGAPPGKGIAALAAMLRAGQSPGSLSISSTTREPREVVSNEPISLSVAKPVPPGVSISTKSSSPSPPTPSGIKVAEVSKINIKKEIVEPPPPISTSTAPALGPLPPAPAAVPVAQVKKANSPSPPPSPTPSSASSTPSTTPSKVSTSSPSSESSPTKEPETRPKGPAIRVVPQQKLMATPPAPQQFTPFRGARPPFPPRPRYDYPPQYPFYHYPPAPVEEFTYVPTSPPPAGYEGPARPGFEGRPPPGGYDIPSRAQPANFEGPVRGPAGGFDPSSRPPGFEGPARPPQSHEGEFSGLVSYFSSQHDDAMES